MNLSLAHIWFTFLHQHYLIYNMSWEDALVDRNLLNLRSDSKVIMISSAGCNALSYLLDQPKFIHTVDINPRQTAVLDLKKQLIKYGDYKSFYEFFWIGKSYDFELIFDSVQNKLSKESRDFWKDHIHYFDPHGTGLFYKGGVGYFAQFLNNIIDRKKLRPTINALSIEPNKNRRSLLFDEIESKLWSGIEQNFWPSQTILSLAGIPNTQRQAIDDLPTFTKKVLRQIFVDQKAENNPYWGRYLQIPHLKPTSDDIHHIDNFQKLQQEIEKITFRSCSLNTFLENSTEHYTHFILLDHMDWKVEKDPQGLVQLWELIREKSKSNASILFRTAFSDLNFLPPQVFKNFDFKQINPEWISMNDRVGTYTGTYIGTKK